jgi:mannose-6-phosphate isomerase-like protein (cupin superfamily)
MSRIESLSPLEVRSVLARHVLLASAICLVMMGAMSGPFYASAGASSEEEAEIRAVLQSFVDSYKTDSMALSVTFGIQIGDRWWHVHSERRQEPYSHAERFTFHRLGPHKVVLHDGKPEQPTWYFKMPDRSVLANLESKVWNAGTASMRSTPADVVALDDGVMEGFESTRKVSAIVYQVAEHFWKKGAVEITEFAQANALETHGAGAVSLYTMKDKRIAWFSILKDQAANADPRLDEGQVPNLIIFTKGRGRAIFADQEVDVRAGMSVFVGPYVKHVISNPYDEPLEGILVLFGDNIDYATGQSYLDFLEKQYEFLETDERASK